MADLNSTEYAAAYVTTPLTPQKGRVYDGGVHVINATGELSAASIGDYLLLGKVKAGQRILGDSFVVHDALGASTTLQLLVRTDDDAATETSVLAATSTSSAGTIDASANGFIATIPYDVTADSILVLKVAGGAATGTVKASIRVV